MLDLKYSRGEGLTKALSERSAGLYEREEVNIAPYGRFF